MVLYFATEARFVKRNGLYYSLGGFSGELLKRYLKHFDSVTVIARVTEDSTINVDESMLATVPGVNYIELPYYIGLFGYLKNQRVIRNILSKSLPLDAQYICRLPGQVGGEVIRYLQKYNIPYSCEVVGNPWDVFAKGSVNHPLRPLIRYISTRRLKAQVYASKACLYVTKTTLQKIYPVKPTSFSVGVSDVIIADKVLASIPKIHTSKEQYTLISVGSMEQMYKAPDVVLTAMSILKNKGFNLRLVWLGDGKFKEEMQSLAKELELTVEFKGNVSSDKVHANIDQSDMFILVSRTEGLPRAIVEAMAHGIPCIGSRVGGIPELLDDAALVDKENPEQLADLIERFITDHNFYNNQAVRNLNEASFYKEEKLDALRNTFFSYIKQQ